MSSDDSNLEETKAQLQMIETALLADPDNADLLQLKSDLHTLLALLQPEADVDHNTASLDSGGDHEKSKDDDGSRLVGARAITSYKQEAPFLVAINPLRYDETMTECSR